jgi:hypothetical protein
MMINKIKLQRAVDTAKAADTNRYSIEGMSFYEALISAQVGPNQTPIRSTIRVVDLLEQLPDADTEIYCDIRGGCMFVF